MLDLSGIFNPGNSNIKISVKGVAIETDDKKVPLFRKGSIQISNKFVYKTPFFDIFFSHTKITIVVKRRIRITKDIILAPNAKGLEKSGTYKLNTKLLFTLGNTSRYNGTFSYNAAKPNAEMGNIVIKSDYPGRVLKEHLEGIIPTKEVLELTSNFWFMKFNKHLDKPVSGKTKAFDSVSGVYKHKKIRGGYVNIPLYKDCAFEERRVIGIINANLLEALKGNMGFPSLINRTGSFAESVKVTTIKEIGDCEFDVNYVYQVRPYSVFDPSVSNYHRLSSEARNPNRIIQESIREVVKKLIGEKFKIVGGI